MREMPKLFQLVVPLCVVLVSTQACAQSRWETNTAAGYEAYEQGDYAEAEKAWSAALQEAEKFGPEDPRMPTSLNNLATVYQAQGKYAEAEPLLKRALAIDQKALDPEHPDTVISLSNLAVLHYPISVFQFSENGFRARLRQESRCFLLLNSTRRSFRSIAANGPCRTFL